MKRITWKIFHKLFFSILFSSGMVLLMMAVFSKWSLDRGFLNYVNKLDARGHDAFIVKLKNHYMERGNWSSLQGNIHLWNDLISSTFDLPPGPGFRPPPPKFQGNDRGLREDTPLDQNPENPPPQRTTQKAGERPPMRSGQPGPREQPPRPRFLDHRLTLFDSQKLRVVGPNSLEADQNFVPIELNNEIVGFLGVLPLKKFTAQEDISFIKEQSLAFVGFGFFLLLTAIISSTLLAKHMVKPIHALTQASKRLTKGEFETRVRVFSQDEIGQLALDFNSMAESLQQNRSARQRWLADISHELRTPLTILRGELEALQDGIRPLNVESIVSLHAETVRLGKTVHDLYELSLSDMGALSYQKEDVVPTDILEQELSSFQTRLSEKQIKVVLTISGSHQAIILGDSQRIFQLFTNLLENSYRYTDPNGALEIDVENLDQQVLIRIKDSEPGITGEERAQIFDRLYRIEHSRNRRFGGAGLGLAICKNIVHAHGGIIEALPSSLGGLEIRISLPVKGWTS